MPFKFLSSLLFSRRIPLCAPGEKLIQNMSNASCLVPKLRAAMPLGLPLSGSAQFSTAGLTTILEMVPTGKKICIVDLRQECHGFVNGHAISWCNERNRANIHRTPQQIEKLQKGKLAALSRLTQITLQHKTTNDFFSLQVDNVCDEQELATALGVGYIRLYITDHLRPSDAIVDQIVALIRQLPADGWLHIHCAAGQGRTTTFMSLVDMMYHGSTLTWQDIACRQWQLGGSDLLTPPTEEEEWKNSAHRERVQFLELFSTYCRANPDFSISWSRWSSNASQN